MASVSFCVWDKVVHQFALWFRTLQFLPVFHWCLLSCYTYSGAQREWQWVSSCVGSLRGIASDSRSFFHWLNLSWFLQPEVMGTYIPGTGILGQGAWCVAGTPLSWDIPPEFLSTIRRCGTSLFCVSDHSTSLDGYGFFISIVVRLQFNLIFDGSEWWLFYILVVILLWLWEEASHVYLCHHLDQKWQINF